MFFATGYRQTAGRGDRLTYRLRAMLLCALLTAQQASVALAADTKTNPDCLVPAGEAATGSVNNMEDLPGGGVLISAENGLFRYDSAQAHLVPVGDAATGAVSNMYDLPGGGVLIGAQNGWFRYDPAQAHLVPVGDAATGGASNMHDLPGGGVLIGAQNGFFIAPALPLSTARVERETNLSGLPLRREVQIRVSFQHPCAPVSNRLGLTLTVSLDGAVHADAPVAIPYETPPAKDQAILSAPLEFDAPGHGTLQLRQGTTAIGMPIPISISGASFWERLVSAWQIVVVISGALYVAAFALLLLATRYTARAFTILNDAVWAKLVTWPFFLLRHIPAIQCWVLEPWFRNVRITTRRDSRFVDPPVSSNERDPASSSSLLGRLGEQPRLWLQGRSGMGKTSIFAAWERAYFASPDATTLRAAARRHGFILVMLPVRHFAAVPPPDANKPETWVLEAVRRRLEQFGLATEDLGLVKAMLNSGQIALAMDGMNEADRDTALAAFARQFPRVRILVTSQGAGNETWEVWRLPETIDALRDQLLIMWLGEEAGAALSRRIIAESLSETIASGYDLALVRDLAGADPEHTALPRDRVALYRAMLARVQDSQGRTLRLEGLKHLAWTMVTQRRREIMPDDEKLLSADVLSALDREGLRIVRRIGKVYEFRHDQMRAFLAALWLSEEMPNIDAAQKTAVDGGAFSINERDQEELWRFLASLTSSEDKLKELWTFASDDPRMRGVLIDAVQAEADKLDITLVRRVRRRPTRKAADAAA
jgi:hypothetical protein